MPRQKDTVWLTQRQMATLFDTSTDNISLHLKNVYDEAELDESAATEDLSSAATVEQGFGEKLFYPNVARRAAICCKLWRKAYHHKKNS